MTAIVLFISGSELFVILLAILLLFGSKQIPDMARAFGKTLKEIRKVTKEISNQLENSDIGSEIKDIKRSTDEIKRDINRSIDL